METVRTVLKHECQFDLLWLTIDDFSHVTVRVYTPYVFRMSRVGVITKQESWTETHWQIVSNKTQQDSQYCSEFLMETSFGTHCAGWLACGRRCGWCKSGRGNTGRCCWWRGRSRTSPCILWLPEPWWEPHRCGGYGSQSTAPGN